MAESACTYCYARVQSSSVIICGWFLDAHGIASNLYIAVSVSTLSVKRVASCLILESSYNKSCLILLLKVHIAIVSASSLTN